MSATACWFLIWSFSLLQNVCFSSPSLRPHAVSTHLLLELQCVWFKWALHLITHGHCVRMESVVTIGINQRLQLRNISASASKVSPNAPSNEEIADAKNRTFTVHRWVFPLLNDYTSICSFSSLLHCRLCIWKCVSWINRMRHFYWHQFLPPYTCAKEAVASLRAIV